MKKMRRSKIISVAIIIAALLVLFGKGSFFSKTAYAAGENNEPGKTAEAESEESSSGTCGEELTWTLAKGTLTISGTGKMTDYVGGNHAPWYNDRNSINKVVIYDGVTSIGAWAFKQCESLTSISIPEGVTRIEHNAFDGCTKLTNINIPKSVTSIGEGAFYLCRSLTSISIPEGVTSIESQTFCACNYLVDISLPSRLTSIGGSAFEFCSCLRSINIPKSVTSIGYYAFCDCGFMSISIPGGVTSIEPYTFWTCYNLKSITIPSSMTSIAASAFDDCPDLEKVYYGGTNWDALKGSFPSGVTLVTTFIISDIDDHTYDGSAYNPTPTVEFGTTLKKDEDYTLSYERKNGSEWEAVTDAIDVGTYRVKVAGVSGSDYAGMTAYKEFFITQKSVTITAMSDNFTYDGSDHSCSYYDVTGLVGNDSIEVTITGSITIPSESPVKNVVSSYQFTTGKAENYNVSTDDGELTMKNASNAITITAASDEKTYDGTPLTNNNVAVTSGSLFTGDRLVASANGSATNVTDTALGNNPVVAGYSVMHGYADVTENYVITDEPGTLTINSKAVTITAQDKEFTYDGNAHSWPEYDVTGLVGTDSIEATITGSISSANQSPVENVVSSYKFKSGIPENYSVKIQNGKLTMTEIPSSTITFDANGGTVTSTSGTTGADGKLTSLPTPDYARHVFKGWFTEASGGTQVTTDTVFTSNETIYAQWDEIPVVSYEVIFKVINGSWNDGTTVDKKVTLRGYEGDVLKLAESQIPEVGNKPGNNYQEGSWDTVPMPEMIITEVKTFTYTYKAKEEDAPKTEVEAPDKEPMENVVTRKFFSGIKVFQKNGNFRISWDKTEGVTKYEVYMTYCGSQYAKKPIVTTTNNKVTIKKLKGKKLNLKKNIKIYVAAYDGSGNSVGKTVSSHVAGKDSKKYTNPKEIKLTTKALTLSKGETVAVKASLKYESKKKKQVGDGHAAKFRYASTDSAIATVDKNGTVTAVASGNCTIYVYSVNGLAKTVTVTVN